MTTLKYWLVALLIAATVPACARAPELVSAAPLAPAENQKLREALLGTWKVVWIEHDGQVDRNGDLLLTFTLDGQNRLQTRGAPALDKTYRYALDGRNIHVKNGPFQVLRADAWDDRTLHLFSYAGSETLICERQSGPRKASR